LEDAIVYGVYLTIIFPASGTLPGGRDKMIAVIDAVLVGLGGKGLATVFQRMSLSSSIEKLRRSFKIDIDSHPPARHP